MFLLCISSSQVGNTLSSESRNSETQREGGNFFYGLTKEACLQGFFLRKEGKSNYLLFLFLICPGLVVEVIPSFAFGCLFLHPSSAATLLGPIDIIVNFICVIS